jgi:hypothetical protein
LATRPAASFVGRIFIDSDNPSTGLYRDTGTAWVQIADPGAGTTGTLQQVTTNGSSTTIGISTSGNGIGIGTTIPGSNRLDIHSASGINATFNGTGTTNAALQFQLAGTGKWNVGNLYNSNNNDFIITDVVNTLNRVTVKNTGQTFIGADTTSSGLFVVNSSSSDSHIVVLGANSPSIRIRDSGSSLVQNVGIGISTGTNAFIQGSASSNYCIFNSSSTASPILFGVYDAGTSNTQEAVRISAARNFLIGTSTDSGYKLNVNGSGYFNSTLFVGGASTITSSLSVKSEGDVIQQNNGSSTGVGFFITTSGSNVYGLLMGSSFTTGKSWIQGGRVDGNTTSYDISLNASGGNVGIGTASPTTKLDVLGAANISSSISIGNSVTVGVAVASTHKVSILIGGVQYYLLASNV